MKDFSCAVAESGPDASVENYPEAERTITVRVTDNGNGVLSVKLLDGSDELIWTNTYTNPDLISIPVEKVWDDADNQDGIRPASVTVRLLADGKDTGKSLVLSEENGWKGAFEGLDEYVGGERIAYTISEDPVEGYSTAIAGDAVKGFTVTNTHSPEEETPPPPPTPKPKPETPDTGAVPLAVWPLALVGAAALLAARRLRRRED